jgi:hypothetical protein
LLEKLSEIHRAGQSQLSKDDYNNFLVGYFYCIAASKEKEGKIMESLAALILSLGFLASSLSGKPSIPFITQTEKYRN